MQIIVSYLLIHDLQLIIAATFNIFKNVLGPRPPSDPQLSCVRVCVTREKRERARPPDDRRLTPPSMIDDDDAIQGD